MFALTMPMAGPYIQEGGPKEVSMIGGALCGLGWLAASYATSPSMLIPLYGIISRLGVGIAYGVPIAVSAQWFPDKRGLQWTYRARLWLLFSRDLIRHVIMKSAGLQIMNILQVYGIAFIIITVVRLCS